MSGIFPEVNDGAVAPGITDPPSYDPINAPVGTLARYFSEQCGVKLRPEVLNAIISQIAAVIDFVGLRYDPSKGHIDMQEAVQYYLQQNRGAFAAADGGPSDFTATGAPPFLGYRQGMVLWLLMPPSTPNSGVTRLNVDGKGFIPILRYDGSPVAPGDLPAATVVGLAFRNNAWQMVAGGTDFMAVARARLPHFPHVDTVTRHMGLTSPAPGQILIPVNIPFLHRGVFLDNSSNYSVGQRTFATASSKTYHVRWSSTLGFRMLDLTDVAYNPTALAEDNVAFDTAFDDLLVARVVTDAGNTATITNLINQYRYRTEISRASSLGSETTTVYPLNMGRTAEINLRTIIPPDAGRDTDLRLNVTQLNRYQVTVYAGTWADPPQGLSTPGYLYNVVMPSGG